MPGHRTRFPKGHTRCFYAMRNMSRELLAQARRIADLRAVAGIGGATVESAILDAMLETFDDLEARATKHLTTKRRAVQR